MSSKAVNGLAILRILRRYSSVKKAISAVHQRHKDDKLMFGGVLETQKEKRKRERAQAKNGEPIKSVGAESVDSEAFWQMTTAPNSVRIIKKNSFKSPEESGPPLKSSIGEGRATSARKPLGMQEILIRNITTVPLLVPKSNNSVPVEEKLAYPSVTRILGATMSDSSKLALERWKQKMIASLGEEGFLVHNKEQLAFGAKFHRVVKESLEGGSPEVDDDLLAVWNSVQTTLKHISDVQFLEENVFHSQLKYKGVVDCVASYKNTPCVIEWKVSEKQKPIISATYDAPLQLTAYMGALSNATPLEIMNGLVVVCYKDGSPAHAFPMDERLCRSHWALWLSRLQHYWLQNLEQYSDQSTTDIVAKK